MLLGGIFVAMAANAGTQNDPLVTLSYLNETFLGQILELVYQYLLVVYVALLPSHHILHIFLHSNSVQSH